MKDISEFYHLQYSQNIEFDISNSEIRKITLLLINYMFSHHNYQEETWLGK